MTVSNLLLEENERALKTRPKVSKNPKNRRTELLEKNTKPQDSMRLEKRSLNAQAFFFQQMVESSNALFYSISPEGEINYLNPEGLRKIGQEFLEIKGENFLKLIPRKFRKSVMEHYQLIMDNNQLFSNLEFPILDHAGKEHWLRHQVRLQLNDNDEVTEIFGAAFDISTHKKTEAEFQRTQQRLASLVTNLPGGVLVENERGEIIIINEFFCNIFNIPITAHWLKGKNCTEFMNNIKQLFKEPAAFLAQSKKLGKERKQVLNEEWTLADGRIIKCDYIPVFEEGLYMGSYYSFWDVTEERHSAVKL